MPKFYLVTGLLALALFSYAQSQGWNMFETTAGGSGSGGTGQSSRIYHK